MVVAIIAGGPSLSLSQIRLLGISRAADLIRVIAVNDAVYPCWFADRVHACDQKWWDEHHGVPGFSGTKSSLEPTRFPDVLTYRNTGTSGLDDATDAIRSGGNSGYQAMHLAVHFGVRKIVLVGFDMTGDPMNHWFGHHPAPIAISVRTMDNRIREFAELKPLLADRGIDVVNASPGSALTFFRAGDLETELNLLE